MTLNIADLYEIDEFHLPIRQPLQSLSLLSSASVVDVFLYNTTKDTDGGAWRLRCQTKSWYTETLNTATRGATREFPAVALIVAETTKVTIYDATVNGCPMWMVLGASVGTTAALGILRGLTSYPITAVYAKEGELVCCLSAADQNGGIHGFKFISDTAFKQSTTAPYTGIVTPLVAYRTTNITTNSVSYGTIVNNTCYDVSMTVRTGAPIDALTGLPVPTIAIATPGGVSIIDGPAGVNTVVDIIGTSNTTVSSVLFDGGDIWFTNLEHNCMGGNVIPSVDFSNTLIYAFFRKRYYYTTAIASPSILGGPGSSKPVRISQSSLAINTTSGVSILKEDSVTPADGMVSYITKDYATGWMRGDIKRAFICDAIKNANLISNGTFDTDYAGWTLNSCTATVGADGITLTAGTTDYSWASTPITTVIGKSYRVTGNFTYSGYPGAITIGTVSGGGALGSSGSLTVTCLAGPLFVATGTTTYINLVHNSTTDGAVIAFDNIVVTETLTNFVTNGTFETDTGWSKGSGWTISGGKANRTVAAISYLSQYSGLTPGKYYTATFTVSNISAGGVRALVGAAGNGTLRTTNGTFSETILCATDGFLYFYADAAFVGSIDDVTVTECILDRSVKATKLTTTGTLTRQPVATGAELQAVSGFSASNYLSQPYSADLDFGTGDFYITGWLKQTPGSTQQVILYRVYSPGGVATGPAYAIQVEPSGVIGLYISGNAFVSYDSVVSTTLVDNSSWTNFICVRRSGRLEMWINGVKEGDLAVVNTTTLTSVNATVTIGCSYALNTILNEGSLSLLRIGAGSLSVAQIAEMYRTELPMFQVNAKCTLQGTADVVNCLDYDERYNALTVGTTDGSATFRDLVIDGDYYAKTGNIKSISADEGMVLEATTALARFEK